MHAPFRCATSQDLPASHPATFPSLPHRGQIRHDRAEPRVCDSGSGQGPAGWPVRPLTAGLCAPPLRSQLPDRQHREKRPVRHLRPSTLRPASGSACVVTFLGRLTAPHGQGGAGALRLREAVAGLWVTFPPVAGVRAVWVGRQFPPTAGQGVEASRRPVHCGEPLPWCRPRGRSRRVLCPDGKAWPSAGPCAASGAPSTRRLVLSQVCPRTTRGKHTVAWCLQPAELRSRPSLSTLERSRPPRETPAPPPAPGAPDLIVSLDPPLLGVS